MRIVVERDALAEAVAWVARALVTKPVIPVLSGMLLQAGEDGLTLSCFDYDVSATVTVEADVAEPGTVLVPGKLLAEITRRLPAFPVGFADDPEGIALTCGEAAFTLVTLPADEYPLMPELPMLAGTVDGGAFSTAISQVTSAASRDDSLPMLTGVNVELDGDTMTLAATDRYRLAMRVLGWNPARRDSATFLVPAKVLADAARLMEPGADVRIMLRGAASDGGAAGDAMIGFESADRRLTTRLLAGEFVAYRSRFPADFGCRAELPADAFAEALRRVSLVAEAGSAVRLTFGSDKVTVEAGTQGHARAQETVSAEFTGDEPVIAFSPVYLRDGINAAMLEAGEVDEPKKLLLSFTSATKPAVITGGAGEDFRYLVVPLRVQQ